jgi:NAD(P)-dependent dehydrogenase (short-subunit alcohol dehydrogenase family)
MSSSRLKPLIIDITDQTSIEAAVAVVSEAVGTDGLSALINNAGIATPGPLEFIPLDHLRHQFEVNVFGQIAVTQAFLPLLRQAHGRIINIGSIAGLLATPFNGPYSATKHAMEAFSDALRGELQPWDIKVILLEPGSISTPIWQKGKKLGRAMLADLPEQVIKLYGPAMDAFEKSALKVAARGIPSEVVAETVAKALTTAEPRSRYLIGQDAVVQATLARFVPDRARDRLIWRELNLPGASSEARVPALPPFLIGAGVALIAVLGLLLGRRRR